jgi:cation:H+ antiporter
MSPFLVFLLSAAAVVLAGIRLAQDGDRIADRTGLGGAWVGAILVAAATSLPELAIDASAVLQGAPDLAVGDLFGSSMFNLLILAVADQLTRQPRMASRFTVNQGMIGVLGILVTTLALLGVATAGLLPSLRVGWATIAIVLVYLAGARLLHFNRPEPPFGTVPERAGPPGRGLRGPILGFTAAAAVILVAAPFLASSAAEIADRLGVSEGFIGVLLVAVTTSLPEVVVTIASLRLGAFDLAAGNLLGSNCFNMTILLPLDLLHGGGPILAAVDPALAIGGLAAVAMTSVVLVDLLDRSERRFWRVEPAPALVAVMYLATLLAIHRATGG